MYIIRRRYKSFPSTSFKGTSLVVPDDAYHFFGDLFDLGKQQTNGRFNTYEVDFMADNFRGCTDCFSDVGAADRFYVGMATAAAERNITIQYCLPSATDMLESLSLPAVIQARASGDYARPEGNTQPWSNVVTLGGASLLMGATRMAPSKDTLWTASPQPDTSSDRTTSGYHTQPHVQLDSILAVLSLGPVGISDALNYTDAGLISQGFRSATDSTLLRPSRPLSTIDAVFTNHSRVSSNTTSAFAIQMTNKSAAGCTGTKSVPVPCCLDLSNWDKAPNAPFAVDDCHPSVNGANQLFTVSAPTGGFSQLRIALDGFCLTAAKTVTASPCVAGSAAQLWSFEADGTVKSKTGGCLATQQYPAKDGGPPLATAACSAANGQQQFGRVNVTVHPGLSLSLTLSLSLSLCPSPPPPSFPPSLSLTLRVPRHQSRHRYFYWTGHQGHARRAQQWWSQLALCVGMDDLCDRHSAGHRLVPGAPCDRKACRSPARRPTDWRCTVGRLRKWHARLRLRHHSQRGGEAGDCSGWQHH